MRFTRPAAVYCGILFTLCHRTSAQDVTTCDDTVVVGILRNGVLTNDPERVAPVGTECLGQCNSNRVEVSGNFARVV